MDHIALMKKQWKFLEKIISREKTIESRWYKNKSAPWNNIKAGDAVYFKNSGEAVSVKAEAAKIICFSELTHKKIKHILDIYGKEIGIEKKDMPKFLKMFEDKKYCILIFLKNPKKIRPFEINKTGFGNMAAWITVSAINKIKV